MKKITTISISSATKKLLEQKKKKDKTWDEFLRELIYAKEKLESLAAAIELEKRFTNEIEKAVNESSKELKMSLKFIEVDL